MLLRYIAYDGIITGSEHDYYVRDVDDMGDIEYTESRGSSGYYDGMRRRDSIAARAAKARAKVVTISADELNAIERSREINNKRIAALFDDYRSRGYEPKTDVTYPYGAVHGTWSRIAYVICTVCEGIVIDPDAHDNSPCRNQPADG